MCGRPARWSGLGRGCVLRGCGWGCLVLGRMAENELVGLARGCVVRCEVAMELEWWTRGVHQPTNAEIFEANNLQPITTTLRRRRLTFAGHCYRSFESAPQPIMDVLFFSLRGTRTRGNRSNYRKLLSEETLLDETSLQNPMLNRDYWRTITRK